MSAQPVKLLCCGSFNPITNMHLRMFELAKDALHTDGRMKVVGGIISPVSDAYSRKELAPTSHRIQMIKTALKGNSWVKLDTWEAEQDTWKETLLVLKHHKEVTQAQHNMNSSTNEAPKKKRRVDNSGSDSTDYGLPRSQSSGSSESDNRPPVPKVKLLCGADLLESFAVPDLWKKEHIEAIVRDFGLVCISRAGSNPEKFIYESDVLTKYKNNIFLTTEWIHNDISSTKIRRALRRGESVKYLLQDSVIEYIIENQLYGAGDNKLHNHLTLSPIHDNMAFQCSQLPLTPSTYLSGLTSFTSPDNDFADSHKSERDEDADDDTKYPAKQQDITQHRRHHSEHNHPYAAEPASKATSKTKYTAGDDAVSLKSASKTIDRARSPNNDISFLEQQRLYNSKSLPSAIASTDPQYEPEKPLYQKITLSSSHSEKMYNKKQKRYARSEEEEDEILYIEQGYPCVTSSVESLEHSPRRLGRSLSTCLGSQHLCEDVGGLVKRVRNMRVALTPETCV